MVGVKFDEVKMEQIEDIAESINNVIKPFVVEQHIDILGEFYMSSRSNTNQRIIIWIVTYWDFDQEPVMTPFNNRENAEKCWAYFKEIHDECYLDECEVFSTFLTPDENRVLLEK